MKFLSLSIAWFLLSFPFRDLPAQIHTPADELKLLQTGKNIENKIDIFVSNNGYNSIKTVDGKKYKLKKADLTINGRKCEVEDLHTHGNTTLYLRRKSFNFHLENSAHISLESEHVKLKKFDAISLSMDKLYMRNRIAFELMEKLKLFHLTYAYADLCINGFHEGIYMIIEHPKEWAFKKKQSPFVIRRGYRHEISKQYVLNSLEKSKAVAYKNRYKEIYKSIRTVSGEDLYNKLSSIMDVEMYFRWLAFNFFIKNTDYTDEVFFYISQKDDRYKIIPWDYDDIFGVAPHEGSEERYKKIGDKLLFSSEDLLDQTIANDRFLYAKYLKQLKHVLLVLDKDVLASAFQRTYSELYPYYVEDDIISMSRHDAYKDADLASLEIEMKLIYQHLVDTRTVYLNDLED